MSIVPVIKGTRLVAAFLRIGFKIVRRKGSHVQLTHPSRPGKVITIPVSRRTLRKGTLIAILKQAGVSLVQLLKLLK